MNISFIYPNTLWLLLLLPLIIGLALLGRRRPTRARFWGGLALRTLLLTLLVLALAGIQIRRRANTLTAVFLLDASDSLPTEEQARGEELIRQAVQAMPLGDRAAIVVFGEDALVERLASEERALPDLTSAPVTVRTDIASALQLGLALLPDEGAKRLVLLSDGRENLGHALAQAELAAAHEIELTFIPLGGPEGEIEVRIDALNVPASVRQGQGFDLTVLVDSTDQVAATLPEFELRWLLPTVRDLSSGMSALEREKAADEAASFRGVADGEAIPPDRGPRRVDPLGNDGGDSAVSGAHP